MKPVEPDFEHTAAEDPLASLRLAWSRLEQAAPEPRPLAEEDEATRRAVAWVQSAWAALEIPELARAPRVRRLPWAIALLPFLLPAALFLFEGQEPLPAPNPQTTRAASALPPVEILENLDPRRVVLRSGPVRLTLLRNPL